MRAPFQILAIPYRVTPELQFCVFHRADIDQYQFVAGGGENDEKPVDAAIREICEETSINTDSVIQLTSMAYVPAVHSTSECYAGKGASGKGKTGL